MTKQLMHTPRSCWACALPGELPGRPARGTPLPSSLLAMLTLLVLLGPESCAPATAVALTSRAATKRASAAVPSIRMAADASRRVPDVGHGASHALRGRKEAWGKDRLGHQDLRTDVEDQLVQARNGGRQVALLDPATGWRQQHQQQQEHQQQHHSQQSQHAQRRLQKQRQLVADGSGDKEEDGAEVAVGAEQPGGTQAASSTDTSPRPASDPSFPSSSSSSSSPSRRCVFILGTGRSGSTALMDALNQLPHYLIRGEQEGAFWYLYLTHRCVHGGAGQA